MKVGKTCFDESCFALTFRLELGVKKTCGFIQPCNGSGSVGEVMEEMFLFSKLVPLELSLITQFTRLLLLGNPLQPQCPTFYDHPSSNGYDQQA